MKHVATWLNKNNSKRVPKLRQTATECMARNKEQVFSMMKCIEVTEVTLLLLIPWMKDHLSQLRTWFPEHFFPPKLVA